MDSYNLFGGAAASWAAVPLPVPDKAALITERHTYTYGQLAEIMKKGKAQAPSLRLITEEKAEDQILAFFLPGRARRSRHYPERRAAGADFAVMASRSMGKPFFLWRTEESWRRFPRAERHFRLGKSHHRLPPRGHGLFAGNSNMALAVLRAGGTMLAADRASPRQ